MPNDAEIAEFVGALRGQRVWMVQREERRPAAFSLSLGRKVPNRELVANDGRARAHVMYYGEFRLYVWSTWRIESERRVASSTQSFDDAAPLLEQLEGGYVTAAHVRGRCLDLDLTIGNLHLAVFCDLVPREPSSRGNWELAIEDRGRLVVGPDFSSSLSRT